MQKGEGARMAAIRSMPELVRPDTHRSWMLLLPAMMRVRGRRGGGRAIGGEQGAVMRVRGSGVNEGVSGDTREEGEL